MASIPISTIDPKIVKTPDYEGDYEFAMVSDARNRVRVSYTAGSNHSWFDLSVDDAEKHANHILEMCQEIRNARGVK